MDMIVNVYIGIQGIKDSRYSAKTLVNPVLQITLQCNEEVNLTGSEVFKVFAILTCSSMSVILKHNNPKISRSVSPARNAVCPLPYFSSHSSRWLSSWLIYKSSLDLYVGLNRRLG